MFTPEQKELLSAPLSTAHVKKNPRGFDYVEAWRAIEEANRIFGFDAWDRETVQITPLGEPREVDGKFRVYYSAKVRITVRHGDGVTTREGCGYGSGIDRDLGGAHEGALKEAESDAMKRALMTFGNPFGLALYDKEKANVTNEPPVVQKSAFLIAAESAIGLCHDQAQLDQWKAENKPNMDKASDAEYQAIAAMWKARSAAVRPKQVA